jgi:cation transporter-like permease
VLVVFGVFFAAGIAAAAFAAAGHSPTVPSSFGWPEAIPDSINQIALTILCVLVPVLLVARRGLAAADLGLARTATVNVSQGIRIAAWAVLALIVSGAITSALATGHYPQGRSIPELTYNLFHAAQAGFIEEIVVLAFVVVTLEQARRPRPEIVAVALVLRASYHIYYGPGVLGIFVWAAVFLWLFYRFRSVIPLIVVHSMWDILVFLAAEWTGVGSLLVLGIAALFLTAGILWLVDRSRRGRAVPQGGGVRPGWYPDPGGSGRWRWFDGWAWTGYVHPPAAPAPLTYPPPVPSARLADVVEGRPGEHNP